LLTFTDFVAVANAAFQQWPRFWEKPDQYLATKMIATMMNAAISESARSSDFDGAFAPSSGGMKLIQTQKRPAPNERRPMQG